MCSIQRCWTMKTYTFKVSISNELHCEKGYTRQNRIYGDTNHMRRDHIVLDSKACEDQRGL